VPLSIPVLAGTGLLVALRWRMNVMSLPEEEASFPGARTRLLRAAIVAGATLVTGASAPPPASWAGWAGRSAPAAAGRPVLPPPAADRGGAGRWLCCSSIPWRHAGTRRDSPGILTAVIGTPSFIVLLRSAHSRAE
jgi:iron complex transport system permease protein